MDNEQNMQNVQTTQRKFVKRGRKKRFSRSKKIIIAVGVTAIVLVVATYAWFVGITRVNVEMFEVNVVTTEGLALSLDGKNWGSTVKVSKGIIGGTENEEIDGIDINKKLIGDGGEYLATAGNVNHWSSAGNTDKKGLEPVSSPGKVFYESDSPSDSKNSQARFFAKTTMTSEKGGYKLTAGEVTSPTAKGYIAFDLFLKNATGASYQSTYNATYDEAIFLTKSSDVRYDTSGGTEGQGIENSVRVGFYALGRVAANTEDASIIQGIDCATTANVTSLCNIGPTGTASSTPVRGDNWNIWEPNDTKHRADAILRYNGACIKRSTTGVYDDSDDNGCTALDLSQDNEGYVNTYAISSPILLSNAIDSNIYDGHNGYTNPNMTLTESLTNTLNRDQEHRTSLLHVAPSSITKIRVYIYLEGQDIDNFDLAAEYQTLKVSFGLTKERFDETRDPDAPPATTE